MVTFLVVIARQRLAPAEARSSRSRRNSQLVSFHQLPHSSKLRIARNSRPLNHFPTLCRKYRGCTPPWECGSSLPLFLPAPMSAPSDIADNCQRAAHSALFPAVFCTFLHCPKSHPLLFQQLPHSLQKNTGGWGMRLRRPSIETPSGRFSTNSAPLRSDRCFWVSSAINCQLSTANSPLTHAAARPWGSNVQHAAAGQRHGEQQDRYAGKRQRIGGAESAQQVRQELRQHRRGHQAHGAGQRQPEPLPQHQPQNVLRLRAQRQPNAAFVRAHEFTKTFAERGKPRAC
jgi:hypothetical protein